MAEYRRSAQSRGYRPGRVDQSNLQRMREDSNRTVQNMRQRAEMEISERRRILAQEKEDQAATRRMEDKNFQIQDQNMRNEIRGLQLKQQADQQQFAADTKANEAIFNTIAQFSETASKVVIAAEEQKQINEITNDQRKTSQDEVINGYIDRVELNALGLEKLAAIQEVEERGADPRATEGMKGSDPALAVNHTFGEVAGWSRRGGFWNGLHTFEMRHAEAKREAGLGDLTYDDKVEIAASFQELVGQMYGDKYKAKFIKPELDYQNAQVAKYLSNAKTQDIKQLKDRRRSMALANIESASPELLNSVFNHSWGHIVDANAGIRTDAWKEVKTALNVQDLETGDFHHKEDQILNIVITTQDHPKGITLGELYTNKQGQPVGILREILSDRMQKTIDFEKQQDQLDTIRNKEYGEELVRAVQLNPTMANIADAQRMYVEKTNGKVYQPLQNIAKYGSIEATHRNNEFQRIASLPDYELTPELVAAAKALNPTEGALVEQRYKEGPGQFRTKPIQDIIKKAESVITGTTEFGTAKLGKAGSLPARIHFRSKIMKQAKLLYGNGQNGYTVEEAVAKATSDESDLYSTTYRTEGAEYHRKLHEDGTISYPWIEARQGNANAAEKAYRKFEVLKEQVKSLGLKSVLNIPNSFMTPERMEYVAQNYGEPGFTPTPLERAVQGFSSGMPLHEVYNRAFAAGGRKETFQAPDVVSAINFTPEQQRILNDANASYESKVHTVNVAAGNTQFYAEAPSMRRGTMFRDAATTNSISSAIEQLTDEDWNELGYVVSGEAARGTDDEFGVAANVLTRLLSGNYGETISDVIRQPDQYEAVTIGTARYEPELAARLKANKDKIIEFYKILDGRTEFKGQSMLKNRVAAEDPMFDPKGNFYHN